MYISLYMYVYAHVLCVYCYMWLNIFVVFAATTIAEHQFSQNPNNTAEDRFHWSPDVEVS